MGVGPIPWMAIREYAQTFELDEAQEEDLFYLIRVMDNSYLEFFSKEKVSSPPAGRQSSSKGAFSS